MDSYMQNAEEQQMMDSYMQNAEEEQMMDSFMQNAEEEEEEQQMMDLPVELLQSILARADLPTIARCAAVCKTLRRHITDPSFPRLCRAETGGGVPPLVGMFHFSPSAETSISFVPASSSTGCCKLSLPVTTGWEPVSSHGGLVLLRRPLPGGCTSARLNSFELCVCSPVTGRYSILRDSFMTRRYDNSLLLPDAAGGDNGDFSFRLLLVDSTCRSQLYSSITGTWDEVIHQSLVATGGTIYKPVQPGAVVLNGVAHWLYRHSALEEDEEGAEDQYQVLAVGIDGCREAATIDIPQRCLPRRRRSSFYIKYEKLLLVADDEGKRLSLLVAEIMAVSILTLSEDGDGSRSWGGRRVLVTMEGMLPSLKMHCSPISSLHVELQWYGQASGLVILQRHCAGIIVLDLKTNDMIQLTQHKDRTVFKSFLPYEMDLVSLLANLKPL